MRDRFSIRAAADAQTLLRLLNLFAQRDLLPLSVVASTQDEAMTVEVEVAEMERGARDLIADKMRQLVLVEDVQCGCHTRTY